MRSYASEREGGGRKREREKEIWKEKMRERKKETERKKERENKSEEERGSKREKGQIEGGKESDRARSGQPNVNNHFHSIGKWYEGLMCMVQMQRKRSEN